MLPYTRVYPSEKVKSLELSFSLSYLQLTEYLKIHFSLSKNDTNKANEDLEAKVSLAFYISEKDLIKHLEFVIARIKAKIVKFILKDVLNWLFIHYPKNKGKKRLYSLIRKFKFFEK